MRKLRLLCRCVAACVIVSPVGINESLQAHPDHPSARARDDQSREPMRISRPQRVAPDDQTQPLETGTRPTIDADELVMLEVMVIDAETKQPLPHRVHIDDADGTYYPPDGHFDIPAPDSNTSNVSYEPDTINDGYDWAMIPEGRFRVPLRAGDGIRVKISHGLEYPIETYSVDLSDHAGATVERTFELSRGINMRAQGWMSADTHVHNLTPLGAVRQMPVEAIDYVNLMFIGRQHALLRRGFLTGQPAAVSTRDHIVYVSQEVRDANQGHMTLIGMKMPIDPIRAYTGTEEAFHLLPVPNEPLNWDVHDEMHAQGGLAYHAHYLYWPGYASAVGAALNKLDGLEWLRTDIASRNDRTRQNIEVPGFGRRSGGMMWYDMLNCGARVPLIGGTDKMNAGRVLGGSCRTYVKVPQWSHDGFLAGLRTGETFVTNGPLLHLSADGRPIGSELKFEGSGPFTVKVETGCFTYRPITRIEILVNGAVVHDVAVEPGTITVKLSHEISLTESSWLAVRARHERSDPDNWHRTITAAHSSPIYITINDRLPAVKSSAEYMTARLETTRRWANEKGLWSSEASKRRALAGIEAAKQFYQSALDRAH